MKSKAGKIAMGLIALILVATVAIPMFSSETKAGFNKSSYAVTDEITDYDAMDIQSILSRQESLTWVFAGDSITHNNQWTQGMNGYAEWFEQYLYDIKRNNDSVINTAWGGADIFDFQTVENTTGKNGTASDPGMGIENFITKYSPDVVFINVGMNDRTQTTATFRTYYETMLASLYDISYHTNKKIPKVVVIAPTPVASENVYDDLHDPQQDLNSSNPDDEHYESTLRLRNTLEEIVEDCNGSGYQVMFCDFRGGFLEKAVEIGEDYYHTFFTDPSDGIIHQNAAGQYLMFNLLSETLGIRDEKMSIFQIAYEEFENAALYTGEYSTTEVIEPSGNASDYSGVLTENSVWVVAGAEQMSGYEGAVVNRSVLRLFDNALRNKTALRDLRIVSAAAPGNTPAYLDTNFDTVIGKHIAAAKAAGNNSVFMLLPEVPEIYEGNYDAATIAAQVSAYKGYIKSVLNKSEADIEILWTPLASGDATVNGYLAEYAKAVREVAAENDGVLLFDAYAYMNKHMEMDDTVARNWFENHGYISPLAATDVTYAFVNEIGNSDIVVTELTEHNLRYVSDVRVFKGNYIRDYYETEVAVVGEKVTLEVSAIVKAGYTLDTSSVALLPEAGTGNYHEDIIWLKDAAADLVYVDNKFTFTAPCPDLHIAIYSEKDGMIYRFKDVDVTVNTDKVLAATPNPTSAVLDTLEIVGVPAVNLEAGDTFDVTLYQYQKYPQVRATAQKGLKITVTYTDKDGKEVSEVVGSGKNSGLIPEEVAIVKVTVSGTVNGSVAEKTYTLNLTRPGYPDIIITEVMQDGYLSYDVSGYDNYELIEIYNASGRDLNLLDYSIGYKIDYPSDLVTNSKGEWPYYFTGNNQAFNGKSRYTGINQITKYSSYWLEDGTITEPTEVPFKADSTMVIWVQKVDSKVLTFDALQKALNENAFAQNQKTLTVDVDGTKTAVVPAEEQLVVAKIPTGASQAVPQVRAAAKASDSGKNFFLNDFGSVVNGETSRGWLFILGKGAQPAANGAITEAGNDIISAGKFVRIADDANNVKPDRLSSVFSYNVERGMSLVKDEAKWDDQYNVGHHSNEQGYNNLTSFGAIEYWQKPADLDDNTSPTVDESGVIFNVDSDTAAVRLKLSDDNDIRYIRLNVKDSEGKVTTVEKDIVLESCVKNGGIAADNKEYEYTYVIEGTDESSKISFWGYVEDGNGNVTEFGGEDEKVEVCKKATKAFTGKEVAGYLADGTYPTMDGALFAGWYTTDSIPTDLEAAREAALRDNEPEESATYYALFVPKHVLSVKAQISSTLYDNDVTNDDSASIRFVTTVDTLQYKQVGFKISYLGKSETIGSHEVYTKLFAVGSSKDVMTEYTPKGEFCQMSNYFKAGTITNVPAAYYGTEFTVTPYWITWDGTTVEGVTVVKTIEQGMPKDTVYVSTDGVDEAGYGTYAYPYATLNYALANVGHSGIICIQGNYTIPADFTWNVHNKRVTITGDALDFSALSELRINDAVTFSNLTLTLPATVHAEGNELVVEDSVELTNTPTVYGGSKKLEVAKTDVKLYAGTYAAIYGGGNGTGVTGDTNVIIGGTVNGAIVYTNHGGTNNLYGGSRYGTVYGNTNIKVEAATARFHYVYGGGYGSTAVVEGSTNVTFAGTAMSVYGGSHTGINSDTHVTMTGGYVEQIFGGTYNNMMTGNTDVRVLGGEVKRRVYGGSYNDQDDKWTTDYRVNGYASVTIDKAAKLSLNMSLKDNGLYAVSRNNVIFEDEKGVFIFNDYLNNTTNIKKIGDNGLSSWVGVVSQAYHYLVKATAGGQVYSVGDKLQIVPDSGYVATVQVGGKVEYYTEGESLYALPKLASKTDQKEIIITFGATPQSTENYEARIGKGYYLTVEDAFHAVTTDTTIELLKASVDVASTLTVSDGESATLKNAEGVSVTVSRADTLTNGSIFSVEAGGALTIEGITLDGRTPAEIKDEITNLAALTGSTASLINTAGEVYLKNVIARYAVKTVRDGADATEGHGAVVYGESVATTFVTIDGSEFSYNKSAKQGGAICLYSNTSGLEVSNSSFVNNEAGENGGAISVHAKTATITDCRFAGNVSAKNGGAFYSGSSSAVTMIATAGANEDALFSENRAVLGGAIGIGSGSNTITGYSFKNNMAATGGGAILNSASNVTATSCYFEGNSAPKGGAIQNQSNGKLYLIADENSAVESMFRKNIATVNGGGAINMDAGSMTANGYAFEANQGNTGGAIYVAAGASAECENNQFIKNTSILSGAYKNGGAIYCGGTYTDKNSSYSENEARGGGAFFVPAGGSANLTGDDAAKAVFKNNRALELDGGVVYVNQTSGVGGSVSVTGYTFEGNTGKTSNSAVYVVANGSVALEKVTFQGTVTQSIDVLGSLKFNNLSGKVLLKAAGNAAEFAVNGSQGKSVVEFTPYEYQSKVVLKKADGISDEVFAVACSAINVTPSSDGKRWCIDETGVLVENPAADVKVGETRVHFMNLQDAVDYANEKGGTGEAEAIEIVVLDNISINDKLKIEKNMTIRNASGKKVTISRAADDVYDMFVVAENATFTLGTNDEDETGALIIDGATTSAIAGRTVTVPAGGAFTLAKNATLQNANSTVTGATIQTASAKTFVYGIISNNITEEDAAGLDAQKGAYVTINGAIFSGNQAKKAPGALCIRAGAEVVCEEALFSGNKTTGITNAGAVYCAGTYTDKNSSYIGNRAKNGGAIFVPAGGNVTLTGTDKTKAIFKDNLATDAADSRGGAIFLNGGSIGVTGYIFEDNTSTGTNANTGEGAVHIVVGSSANLIDVVFQGTKTQNIYYKDGTLTYSNVELGDKAKFVKF